MTSQKVSNYLLGEYKVKTRVNASNEHTQVVTTSAIEGCTSGRKTSTSPGTAVALTTTTACYKIDITALSGNAGTVVIGGAAVVASLATRKGIPLAASDFYSLEIDDASKIYIDVTNSGDGVSYNIWT